MPYPPKVSTPSEADLAINQVLLAHAELQKNLKRFLGPVTATTNTELVGADGRDEDQGNIADGGSDDEFVAEDETYVSSLLFYCSLLPAFSIHLAKFYVLTLSIIVSTVMAS